MSSRSKAPAFSLYRLRKKSPRHFIVTVVIAAAKDEAGKGTLERRSVPICHHATGAGASPSSLSHDHGVAVGGPVRPPAPSGAPLAKPTRSTEHDRVTAAATTDPAGHPQRLQPLRALRPRPCRPRRRRRRLRCALPARAASMASPRPTRTIAAVQSCSEPAGQLRRRSTRRPAEPRNSAPRPAPLAPPSAGAGLHGRSPAGRRPLARPRTTPPRALEETSPLLWWPAQ